MEQPVQQDPVPEADASADTILPESDADDTIVPESDADDDAIVSKDDTAADTEDAADDSDTDNNAGTVADDTASDVATFTDLNARDDEEEEETEVSIFTIHEQWASNSVRLVWNAVSGAKYYSVRYRKAGATSWGSAVKKATTRNHTFTGLAAGDYEFQVIAWKDTGYKTKVNTYETTATVGNWKWALAPKSISVTWPTKTEGVLKVIFTPNTYTVGDAKGPDGYQISNNKSTSLLFVEETPNYKSSTMYREYLTVANGTYTLYVRPFRYAADGKTKIYGSWSAASKKITVKVAWKSTKTTVTLKQTDEYKVKVSWTKVSGASGYAVYELVNGSKKRLTTTTALKATVTASSYGKHTYYVRPLLVNSRGETEYGSYSAAKAITTKVAWSQAPTVSCIQTAEHAVTLKWTIPVTNAIADGYQVYGKEKGSSSYTKLGTVTDGSMTFVTDPSTFYMKVGTTYYFKVRPIKKTDGTTTYGTYSAYITVTKINAWKVVYDAAIRQVSASSAMLTWKSAGSPAYYRIYRKSGSKYVLYRTLAASDVGTYGDSLCYTITGMKSGTTYAYYVIPAKKSGSKYVEGVKSAVKSITCGTFNAFTVSNGVLTKYNGVSTTVTVPSDVTAIGASAFAGNTIVKTVKLGGTVITIGDNAFKGCTALAKVTGTAAVTTIGASAFENDTALTTFTATDTIKTIGANAFKNCPKLDLSFMDKLGDDTEVGDGAFAGLVTEDDSWKTAAIAVAVAYNGFGKATLTWDSLGSGFSYEISVDGSVLATQTACSYTYALDSDLTEATVTVAIRARARDTAGRMSYGEETSVSLSFDESSTRLCTIDDVVYELNGSEVTVKAYNGSESSLKIPGTVDGYTVTVIGAQAFKGNTALKSIDLPDSITLLDTECFSGCSSLTTMN